MIPETLAEASRRFATDVAYVAPDGARFTYADLDGVSAEVAAGLALHHGVREGDVVGLTLPPGPEYLLVYLAAARLGAITAGVNERLSAAERTAVLARAAPTLVVAPTMTRSEAGARPADALSADAPSADAAAPTITVETGGGVASILGALRVRGGVPIPLPSDRDRPVAIVFTSGTTGVPKGALYTNRQLAFITDTDVGDRWGTGGRGYAGTSFATLGFMTKLPGALRRGGTTFIMRRWRAQEALALVARERLSTVSGVPTQVALMLRDPEMERVDLSSVGFVIVGGGPLTPGLAQEIRDRLRARLATRYSCTEAGIGLGTAFDDPPEDAVDTVGRPHASVDLAVLDDADGPVDAGRVGHVALRSPAVMSAYWRDAEATAAAFTSDGYVRTGDLGFVDERGRLHLTGRTKEMYVRGGYNVYPVEVEAVLSTHPDVAAVAIVPRPDPVMGEVGVAAVVPRTPGHAPTLDALRSHGAGRLAAYKLPERIVVLDALPLTAAEKIDRVALARAVG